MATKNEYLVYLINLTDKALVETLQGQTHTGGAVGAVIMAPDVAATTYGAVKLTTNLSQFAPPCLSSEWFTAGSDFPTNVDRFDRKSGGWFGISWLFGSTTHYYWRGKFVYAPPAVPEINGVPAGAPSNLQRVRWTDSNQLPTNGEGGQGNLGNSGFARMASRHVDGFGFALNEETNIRSHLVTELNPGLTPNKSWERMYIRPMRFPAVATTFWRCRGSIQNETGIVLQLTPGGSIAVLQIDAAGAGSLIATTGAQTLNQWIRLDLLIQMGLGATLQVVINGVAVLNVVSFVATGFAVAGRTHVSSEIGPGVANTMALHLCEWICKDYPVTFDGHDWLLGTKLQLVSPKGFAAANVWAGDWRTLLQNPQQGAVDQLNNALNGQVLALTTDAEYTVDALVGARGVASLQVCIFSGTAGAGGTIGYSVNGGAAVMSVGNVAENAPGIWQRVILQGSGAATPIDITPLELYHAHGADNAAAFVKSFFAIAEVMGVFGPEDVTAELVGDPDPKPGPAGIHNAPYPRSPWASRTSKPAMQPVYKKTGTYVGNGTGQDIAFTVPPCFIWVRPLTGGAGGFVWFSSMLGVHPRGGEQHVEANLMPQALIDPTFVPLGGVAGNDLPAAPATVDEAMQLASALAYNPPTKHTDAAAWALYLTDPTYYFKRMLGWMLLDGDPNEADYGLYAFPPSGWINTQQQQALLRLSGANANSNAAGVTYAYMAFCDPAMRFCLAGALANNRGGADVDTALFDPAFTPISGFFQRESISALATIELFHKGSGHAATSLSALNAAEQAASLQMSAGHLVSKAAFHSAAVQQIAFALWRMNDGSADVGIPRVICLMSYVGDGSATRTIALLPASGRRPMWAIITPHNAASIYRDPSHTGTNSTQVPNTNNAATGIIGGGLDSIQVGLVLNANLVTYEVLAFPGLVAAGNGGWSPPGDDFPVDPDPPDGPGPWAPDPPVDVPPTDDPGPGTPGIPDPLPPVGPMPGLTDDLDPACEPDTRRIINVALSRLGSTKQILNVATDVTPEATTARLVYKDAVEATLRDFPWPFATRYVQLALVASAPNSDWAFSYRQPNDCLFERRIVVSRSAAIDAPTIPFQLSSDDTGGLLFTNLSAAVLEYTARPKCPHTRSEPLFRDAVSWRLAAAMAPGLTRMSSRAVECMKDYAATLQLASDVLRPGNPGPAAAASTVDTTAAAIAANLIVANWALVRIGAQTVRNLTTDQSREAIAVRLVFESELQATLRDFPWAFATVYFAPTLVAGTPTVRVNNDWHYAYRLPADAMTVRRIVTEAGRAFERNPEQFRIGRDATGPLLYANRATSTTAPLTIEYTTRPADCVAIADPLFRDAFAWRLASSLAPSLAQKDPETIEQRGRGPEDPRTPKERPATGNQLRARAALYALQRYRDTLATARVSSANEQQPDTVPGDADWIRGRE